MNESDELKIDMKKRLEGYGNIVKDIKSKKLSFEEGKRIIIADLQNKRLELKNKLKNIPGVENE